MEISKSLKLKAIRYLSRREYSRRELTQKLSCHSKLGSNLDDLMEWLKIKNLQSDYRFAETLINRKKENFGYKRINLELKTHGINLDEIPELKKILINSEEKSAHKAFEKKFNNSQISYADKLKHFNYLRRKGFSTPVIEKLVKNFYK
tara:strand:+ start:377 stop:820 length:444 start_codon:yes stop_codon:yes gene_type:complete